MTAAGKKQVLRSLRSHQDDNCDSHASTKIPMRKLSLPLAGLLALALTTAASAQTKLLRFPDIHGDRVVFTYGGDLWTAASRAGPRRG